MASGAENPAGFSPRALRASAIAAGVALGVALLLFEGRVLMLLLAGALVALALNGVCGWLAERLHARYVVVLVSFVALMVGLAAASAVFLGGRLVAEVHKFLGELPQAWQSVVAAVHAHPDLQQLVGPLEGKAPGPSADPSKLMSNTARALDGAGEVMAGLMVVFFLGLYGAAQPGVYPRLALRLVPIAHRHRGQLILDEMEHELKRWLLGRLVAMVFVGVFVTIGLLALKIELAIPLGIFAALLTFVEYLGAIASALPACLLAFARGPIYFVWVGVLFTVAHIIEGYALTPLLSRTTVRFPPAYTLAFQVMLGSIFGVAGLTFATPIAIVGSVLLRRLYPPAALDDPS